MLRIDEHEAHAGQACERLRFAALVTTVFALLIAAIPAPFLGLRWSAEGSASAALCLVVLLGGSLRLRSFGRAGALASFSEILGVLLLGGIAAAAVAMVALRSGAPMADPLLKSLDLAFGLSAQAVVAWVAEIGAPVELLHLIYHSSFFQIAASVLLLPFLGRRLEAWRLCFLFLICLLSCALISVALPAYGSFVDATPVTMNALPPGAGTFFWESLDRCRSAAIAVVGLHDLGGVISFPSFHTIMALLMMQAWSWNRLLRWSVVAANLAVIFTTLPMGGHYFMDLAAGALLWMAWSRIADAIAGRRAPGYAASKPNPLDDRNPRTPPLRVCVRGNYEAGRRRIAGQGEDHREISRKRAPRARFLRPRARPSAQGWFGRSG